MLYEYTVGECPSRKFLCEECLRVGHHAYILQAPTRSVRLIVVIWREWLSPHPHLALKYRSPVFAWQDLNLFPSLHLLSRSFSLTVAALGAPVLRGSTMSSSVQPTQSPQSSSTSGLDPNQTSVLGPGIIGIFIQGIECGLVFAQFSRWYFRSDRSGNYVISIIVIYVTIVGLYASSRLIFAPSHSL